MSPTHSFSLRGLSFPACTRVGAMDPPWLELSFMPLVLSLVGQCRTGRAAGKPRPPGPSGEYRVEPWGPPRASRFSSTKRPGTLWPTAPKWREWLMRWKSHTQDLCSGPCPCSAQAFSPTLAWVRPHHLDSCPSLLLDYTNPPRWLSGI